MLTCQCLLGDPPGHDPQVQERRGHAFHVPKHGRQAQAVEHPEEEHGPDRRAGHLEHSLREDNEGQARARGAL